MEGPHYDLPIRLDWLPMNFYFALAGGTMPFIRRYSTIWP